MTLRRRRPTDLELVAHHEAAHAIVALAIGRRVERVSVVPSRLSAGRCTITGLGAPAMCGRRASPKALKRSQQNTLIYLAGAIAELELDPLADVEESGGPDELMAMFSAVPFAGRKRHDRGRWVHQMRREARTLVRSHWQAIRCLARALKHRKVLRGGQVSRILRGHLVGRKRQRRE